MIKNFIVMLLLQCAIPVFSCDICGGSVGSGMGILSDYKYNRISFQFFEYGFSTLGDLHTLEDHFSQMNVSVTYFVHPKIALNMGQGYQWNNRQSQDDELSWKGWNASTLGINYTLISETFKNEATLFLSSGADVILPTGTFNADMRDLDLPENFNISTQSWASNLKMQLVYDWKKWGGILKSNFKLNTASPNNYTLGNQLNSSLIIYRSIETYNIDLVPFVGLSHEHLNQDILSNGKKADLTGGDFTLLSTGINFKLKNWILGASYFLPVKTTSMNTDLHVNNRLNLNLTYIF